MGARATTTTMMAVVRAATGAGGRTILLMWPATKTGPHSPVPTNRATTNGVAIWHQQQKQRRLPHPPTPRHPHPSPRHQPRQQQATTILLVAAPAATGVGGSPLPRKLAAISGARLRVLRREVRMCGAANIRSPSTKFDE